MLIFEFHLHRRGRGMRVVVEAPDAERAARIVRNAVGPGDAELIESRAIATEDHAVACCTPLTIGAELQHEWDRQHAGVRPGDRHRLP